MMIVIIKIIFNEWNGNKTMLLVNNGDGIHNIDSDDHVPHHNFPYVIEKKTQHNQFLIFEDKSGIFTR